MKNHYIYFSILPVLLFAAFLLPLTVQYWDGERIIENSFDDEVTWIIFTIPTLVSTVLLLIPHYVTALIGTCFYLIAFGISIFMNYSIYFSRFSDDGGLGPAAILTVLLSGLLLGLFHTIYSYKNRKNPVSAQSDILDSSI